MSNDETDIKTVDDDKLLTPSECSEAFGLGEKIWRAAIKEGRVLHAYEKGPTGYLIQGRHARAFARAWHDAHTNTNNTTEPST